MLLGVIADDLTGATDVALMLAREGMRVIQTVGVPASAAALPDADAVVVSMKSRTNPAAEAVEWSLAACDALLGAGARQILFKYCSTFDSTDAGNIGPVAEALMDRLGAAYTVACPAFPANGRSVYQGHLFVGSVLLSDSPMKDHPLTPMRDSNLVRVLARQTRLPVGLVPFQTVSKGAAATRGAFEALAKDGPAIGVARRDHGPGPPHARCGVRRGAAPDGRLGHRARPAREFQARRPVAACFRLAALHTPPTGIRPSWPEAARPRRAARSRTPSSRGIPASASILLRSPKGG